MRRPFVLINAAVSLDGKLAPASRSRVRLGSDRDRARMDRLRASADAILIGAGTLRSEDPPLQVRSAALRRRREREGRPSQLLEVLLSRSLELPLQGRFFRPSEAPRLIVAPRSAPAARLARLRALRDGVSRSAGPRPSGRRARETPPSAPHRAGRPPEVVTMGTRTVDVALLLDLLAGRRMRRVLVEGGGEVFAHFLEADLVDEIHLTVCPLLVGGRDAPTLFDGAGFEDAFPRRRLDLCRREGDEVYLRYVRPGRAPRGSRP